MRAMKLLTKEIVDRVPEHGAQDGKGEDALVYAKLFTPDAQWTWLITEYDEPTDMAYGYVCGLEEEWGYIHLPELRSVRGPMGLPIERDMHIGVGKRTVRELLEGMGRR